MRKFFVESDQIIEDKIFILDKDVKHIRDVLRLRTGDRIEISCDGVIYLCQIDDILRDKVILDILSNSKGENEPEIEIVLFQGLAKSNKMDFIIQKGTEIGIKDFYGVITDRTIVKIKDIKKEKNKISRWDLIAEEAAKQSKRDYIPKIKGIISFDEMIELIKDEESIIVPYEDEENLSIGNGLRNIKSKKINLIIGPEGGFEPDEIQKIEDIGGKIVSLGPRILRTETAGFVSATIILYELGKLGVI
ncbi:RsmE family RNA methyltransferase [Wansuia hejianensis]|uniref:Ribosomal RNA small subunit methyltransferase E n=1 Tax=Wansuia hejianensis TaxID=2763667 RepID=A0A926IMT5_9FIRM|nr:RsmE family RNA methyltransferase [Wansuia hejianensis]MBC8590775.1 16S rRNA (uracil(1498)-N(3))-methyltransferase [Wansuia hejianensis]